MMATVGCRSLVLDIGVYRFTISLIVLDSQGLDVIMCMDWMSKHGGQINCLRRAIKLTTLEGKKLRYRSLANFGN
jgi:hypothetical protein